MARTQADVMATVLEVSDGFTDTFKNFQTGVRTMNTHGAPARVGREFQQIGEAAGAAGNTIHTLLVPAFSALSLGIGAAFLAAKALIALGADDADVQAWVAAFSKQFVARMVSRIDRLSRASASGKEPRSQGGMDDRGPSARSD
jgi:fatty acid-binding protein DegV